MVLRLSPGLFGRDADTARVSRRALRGRSGFAVRAVCERGEHARMLEHAATRRRRAAKGEDAAYWRACAPAALARATAVRHAVGFARLP